MRARERKNQKKSKIKKKKGKKNRAIKIAKEHEPECIDAHLLHSALLPKQKRIVRVQLRTHENATDSTARGKGRGQGKKGRRGERVRRENRK